ncbi:MAG: NTP transferase domain-containing protein [Candidatus Methanomethylophilaceae archaeon]|jgi:adenosylcobinamide-phosphate guanylyltransferase|nr:NTP transferase domain-containing protein [Candidatus Methanomethylophilaceae archaeon]
MMKFEALINAGGKGSRMMNGGIEKPMLAVGGRPTVMHVISALQGSKHITSILVSVSSNTPHTERYLNDMGIETVRTSGDSYMNDIHSALGTMSSDYVLTSPSDIPLLSSKAIDLVGEAFEPDMQSMITVVDEEVVTRFGIVPSYTIALDGRTWVMSGINIMDRKLTLDGEYLQEEYCKCSCIDLAVNVNTVQELQMARWLTGYP